MTNQKLTNDLRVIDEVDVQFDAGQPEQEPAAPKTRAPAMPKSRTAAELQHRVFRARAVRCA